ncbi:hypothetical protein FGO68_gene15632 [Halteria grandinella]|uniref:Uncharacterized protein n=1 Tax=Halteria grandinella TaxID=5974 RepID=A0A8J8SV24_HALGN|nr:hypothetical protein FGO68_gene15632 [Halteria grandinella]
MSNLDFENIDAVSLLQIALYKQQSSIEQKVWEYLNNTLQFTIGKDFFITSDDGDMIDQDDSELSAFRKSNYQYKIDM